MTEDSTSVDPGDPTKLPWQPTEPEPSETEPEPSETEPEPSERMEIVRLVEGSFVDRSHPTDGDLPWCSTFCTEQRFLRFEDFATDNGPDLNVYLSSAPADAPVRRFR